MVFGGRGRPPDDDSGARGSAALGEAPGPTISRRRFCLARALNSAQNNGEFTYKLRIRA